MIRHYLNFISSKHGLVEIDEPYGFASADFGIEQASGRKGRDVTYAAKKQLTIYKHLNQAFEIYQYNRERFGYEADIKYCVSFVDEEIITVGQAITTGTDRNTYYEFVIIEIAEKQLFKRRYDVNTNVFSDKTLDDAYIDPVNKIKVLIKAKPIIDISKWETPIAGGQSISVVGLGGTGPTLIRHFNFANIQIQYDIKSSSSYIQGNGPANDFIYITAENNLSNVVIDISDLTYLIKGTGNGSGSIDLKYYIGYPEDLTGATYGQGEVLNVVYVNNDEEGGETNASYKIEIPFIERGKSVFIWFRTIAVVETNFDTFGLVTTLTSMKISITATSTAYSSVIDMVRLIDVMRYNAKSSAKLNVFAPRWQSGGELYNQCLTTQPLMRGLLDKPFNVSTKDIVEKYLPEVFGDYQIEEDGTVFYGAADENGDDFYQPIQIADFTQQELSNEFGQPLGQIQGFEETDNEIFAINQFSLGYETYASQKENEQANTYDDVHGETEWLIRNKNKENKKEVKIGVVRSAFSWESARVKAYDLTKSAATQDDDKLYINEITPLTETDRTRRETSLLQHLADENRLTLANDQTFSWRLLGIEVGDVFIIETGDNAGSYYVVDVSDLRLVLEGEEGISISEENTTYIYRVGDTVQFTNRTNEGFQKIENIEYGTNYANLPFTTKRNIIKRYGRYLATCVMNASNKEIKNTLYKNNPLALTQLYEESEIVEGDSFTPINPILTQNTIKVSLLMTLESFFNLRDLLKTKKGYIKTFDSNGLPLNGFIQKGSWTFLSKAAIDTSGFVGVLEAELEEKYEQFYMYIFSNGNGIIINDTIAPNDFDFEINSYEKLIIFDETGKQLFVPVPYNKVKVNNSGPANSVYELTQWLNILKS